MYMLYQFIKRHKKKHKKLKKKHIFLRIRTVKLNKHKRLNEGQLRYKHSIDYH